MIKIIIYIIAIYVLIRFVRAIMNTHVIIKKFDSRTYNESFRKKNGREGEVTIIETPDKKNTGVKGEPGDYIDYEEMK